jgi:multiple sugar transport system permease protein
MYGMMTGTISSGILLLREIDSDFHTPAANNLVSGSSVGIILGAPVLVLVSLAAKSDLMAIVVCLIAAVYLAAGAVGVILYRLLPYASWLNLLLADVGATAVVFAFSTLLNRIRPAGALFRSSVLLPYLMPCSAVLMIWLLWFDYGGPVNRLITALGGTRVFWLQGAELRLPVILLFLWKNLGFCVVIFLAALQAIPESLYEYAILEGASFPRQAFSITLPLIVPSAFLVFILSFVNAFRIFKEVYFIGGAYPEEPLYTLQNYMNNMYGRLNYQNVTTAAYIFAVMVFALFGLLFFLQNRAQRGLN